jgi:hypothetical protein
VGNGNSSGAFGFALIFLLLFLSRKKVNKEHASQNEIPLNGSIPIFLSKFPTLGKTA